MTSFTLRSAPAICSVIFFCLAQLSVFAQSPTPTPPDIVYKIRGSVCEEEYGGVGGSTNCTPISETTNTNFSRSIVGSTSTKESSLNVTVVPTETSNVLQASMGSRLQRLHVGGPSFIGSAKAFLDVEVYVRESPSNIYTIFIDGSSAGNQHNRPPSSGGFGCPCGTQNSSGSATLLAEVTLYGTASQLGSQVVSFPEFPGVNYRLAYQRSQNDWDYITSASGGVNDWDFDADLYADAFLSLNIFAISRCPVKIERVCRPIPNLYRFRCPQFIGKHCFFVLTYQNGTKKRLGAYDRGALRPKYDDRDDYVPSPAECSSDEDDLTTTTCKDLTPLLINKGMCDAYRILHEGYLAGPQGDYNQKTNNSNAWLKKRCDALGVNCMLPSSAPTNDVEYCSFKKRMLDDIFSLPGCNYATGTVSLLINDWFTEPCP